MTTRMVAVVATSLVLSFGGAGTAMSAGSPPTDTRIAAGNDCLRYKIESTRRGVSTSTTLVLTNSCARELGAYVCMGVRFAGSSGDSCRFVGDFNPMRFRPGELRNMSLSSGGSPYVQIRECPAGYKTRQGLIKNWECDR